MNYEIDKKVYAFIMSQENQVKYLLLEILDQIPTLLEKIENNLKANAFESAIEAKDVITQYMSAIRSYSMQYHNKFGILDKIWSDEEVKMIINEATRLYGIATDLIVNKFRELNGHGGHGGHVHI